MFNHVLSSLGPHRSLEVKDKYHNHHFIWLPEKSALPTKIQFFGIDVVEPVHDLHLLNHDHWFRNFWLIPYPNRIRNGQYKFNGTEYQLEIGEPKYNNAIHGFFDNQKSLDFKVSNQGDVLQFSSNYFYEGDQPGYPFKFELDVIYKVSIDGDYQIRINVKNRDSEAIPFGLGWHPYFQLDGDKSNWLAHCSPFSRYVLDERSIPTGELRDDIDYNNIRLADLDDCFIYKKRPFNFVLKSKNYQLKINQSDNLPFLQLFTPPNRNSLAVEPMSCGINAFNDQPELVMLQLNETKSFDISLKVDKLNSAE